MLHYKEYIPGPQLKDFVKLFYLLDHTNPHAYNSTYQRVTPDGCFELNFPLSDPIIRKDNHRSTLVGEAYLNTRFNDHYFVKRTGVTRLAGVRFYPWGLHAFLGSHSENNSFVPADDLFGNSVHELHHRLYFANSDAEIIKLLEHQLTRMLQAKREHVLVQAACKKIAAAKGHIQLEGLAGDMGLSLRRLQQLFLQITGTNPKQIVRLIRFRYAVHLLTHNQFSKLSDVAYESHYTDQSHFIREFSLFSGVSPKEYYREQHPLDDLSATSSLFME